MRPNFSSNKQRNVVLIADLIAPTTAKFSTHQRNFEQSDPETVEILMATVKNLGRKITHYQHPTELANNAHKHIDDVVLTIYGGASSRNRMALVPAICESYDLSFIGPDVYGRIAAQDKEVSKRLARDCGLTTPDWRIVRDARDLEKLMHLTYPCVVKPLSEGSSIGITQASIVHYSMDAEEVSKQLLIEFNSPVIIEQFVRGRETSFVAIESNQGLQWAYSEIVIAGQPEFFNENVFDASEKMFPILSRSVANIDVALSEKDRLDIEKYLKSFGQFGYCRVDGHTKEL